MHVDATGLTVMDLTADHSGIGVRLHLKAGDTVPVDVTALEIALATERTTTFPAHIHKPFTKNTEMCDTPVLRGSLPCRGQR